MRVLYFNHGHSHRYITLEHNVYSDQGTSLPLNAHEILTTLCDVIFINIPDASCCSTLMFIYRGKHIILLVQLSIDVSCFYYALIEDGNTIQDASSEYAKVFETQNHLDL